MIQVPRNPLTLQINGWIVDWYLNNLHKKYLPEYEIQITSGYRSPTEQAELRDKGFDAPVNSAHLYNLARDFVLRRGGRILSDAEMKSVFDSRIAPYWEGYVVFNPKNPGTSSGWIHANIDREITRATMYLGVAGSVLAVGFFANKWIKKNLIKGKAQ